jgi:transcriptional regulator with XRE-family HTH domain
MTTKPSLRQQEQADIQEQLSSFGERLRELRVQHGLTLQELAAQSGLSKAFLSRLESGDRQASISAALTLSKIFRVSLASLFESPAARSFCTIIRAADAVEKSANGLRFTPLSNADRFFNVRPMRVKVSPSRRGSEHYRHEGEEWVYVLHGKLTLSLAGRTYDLEEGDAAHFESRLPHRLIARGGREAEILVVAAADWGRPKDTSAGVDRAIPAGGFLALPEGKPAQPAGIERRRKIHHKK